MPLHTLRAWERRYGVPRPDRNSENRYRLYDEQDIADVLWMKRQVESGVSPAQASALLRQGNHDMVFTPARAAAATAPVTEMQRALFDAFVQRDDIAAQRVMNQAWSILAPEQVVVEILQPTMQQIGNGWQQNLLSVEQEHFASNIVRQRLHALIQAQPTPSLTAPRVVAACAPEEQHDLGLLIFTLLAKRHGWQVNYLGQRTPLAELQHAGQGAQFIVLSVATVTGLASLLPIWNEPLTTAPVLFGGEIFNVAPALRQHIPGAYLGENGVAAMQTLTTTTPRVSEWKPSRRLLHNALALDGARLPIVTETVRAYMAQVPAMKVSARHQFQNEMTHAAMFLTDALVSAFAFDVPELLDVQGAWATEFMPAHRVSRFSLQIFVDSYAANCARLLDADIAQAVKTLLGRMMTAMGEKVV